MIEFEMKLKHDHESIRSRLEELDAHLINIDYNIDQYFSHPNRNFAETDEALRIRETSETQKITYKGPKFDRRSKSRQEIDISLAEDGMDRLLETLGFQKSGIVKKERETWRYKQMTITLDRVEELGEYIEVELIGEDSADKDSIIQELRSFVTELGMNPDNQIVESYLELLQGKN